jgi:hypothetical protein
MADRFLRYADTGSNDKSSRKALAITPVNTTPLTDIPRRIYVGGTGDINCILVGDTSNTLFKNIPVGTFPISPSVVHATGTTATFIVAMY